MSTDHVHSSQAVTSGLPQRAFWGAVVMVALIGLVFVLREHWAHLAGSWVYLLLLACPLMHLFHGHGGHGNHRDTRSSPPEAKVR